MAHHIKYPGLLGFFILSQGGMIDYKIKHNSGAAINLNNRYRCEIDFLIVNDLQ